MGEYADMLINDEIDKACRLGDNKNRTIAEMAVETANCPPPQRRTQPWKGIGDPTPRHAGVAQPWAPVAPLPKGLDQLLVGEIATCTVCNMGNLKVSLDLGKLRLRDENGFWHGCDPAAKSLSDEIQVAKDLPF
jgi:hypothetical protein